MGYITNNLADIMTHIKTVQANQTVFEAKLLDIYEGSLQKYVEESIDAEFSAQAAQRAKQRIAPINILPKIIKKISAVYTFGAMRMSNGNNFDTEMMSYYENNLAFNSVMDTANKYLNLFRYCAIEPYVNKGKPDIRVLPPTQFTVWSDNRINPLEPTVFIKYVGKAEDLNLPRTDTDGVSQMQPENIVNEIDIFHMYSDNEFVVVDANGAVRLDLMRENPEGVNYYGRIPFVYLSQSDNFLIPLPNTDMFQLTILAPKLLTDLNYATKFQSHAIVYSIDIDSEALDGNPDQFWSLKSEEGENKNPTVGTIKPEVDIDKVLLLIKDTLAMWFDSLGMKSSGISNISAVSAQSGIAKAIDNADIEEVRSCQKPIMKAAELELWDLLKVQHDVWSRFNLLDELRPFSNSFDPSIMYNDPEPTIDYKVKIEGAALKFEKGLTSFRRAVSEANSDLNNEELEELIAEMNAEKEERMLSANNNFNNTKDDEETDEDVEEEEKPSEE